MAVRIALAVASARDDVRASDHLAGEVRMRSVDARVEHRDRRVCGRCHRITRRIPADARQRPLVAIARVVRHRRRVAAAIALDAHDVGVCLQRGDGRLLDPLRHVDRVHEERRDRAGVYRARRDDLRLLLRL